MADFVFDEIEAACGFLDAGAGWAADVEAHLAGVDGGEEIFAHFEKQGAGGEDEDGEGEDDGGAMVEGPGEEAAVEAAEFFEEGVEGVVETDDEPDEGDEGGEAENSLDDQLPVFEGPAVGAFKLRDIFGEGSVNQRGGGGDEQDNRDCDEGAEGDLRDLRWNRHLAVFERLLWRGGRRRRGGRPCRGRRRSVRLRWRGGSGSWWGRGFG